MQHRRAFKRYGPQQADHLVVAFSDIEMGSGGPIDDFPHSGFLGELILEYNEGEFSGIPIDLVFNGDTFDLLKTPYFGAHPRHITCDVALGKMSLVAAAHPRFFESLRRFLKTGKARRRIHFVVGNHDPELLFPEVQELIRSLCGDRTHVHFPGLTFDIGRVHIEHGGQHDPIFRIDPTAPFADYRGEQVLNIAWGSAALLDTVLAYQPLLFFLDRLKPKEDVFNWLPEVKELLLAAFWRYWTKDYWRGYFGTNDPTKKLSWTMLKEVLARFASQQPDVFMDQTLLQQMERDDRVHLFLVGHQHVPGWRTYGDRKLLQTGCMRDEFMLADEGHVLRPIQKVFAEIWMDGETPVQSELREVRGPPSPSGHMPQSIFDVLPEVRMLLAGLQERSETREAQRKQEEREARASKEKAGNNH